MQAKARPRQGFTLIELLVVIAIIGVLVALTAAGVIKILSKGPEVQCQNEITQMSNGLQNFKQKMGIYPPSYIILGGSRAIIQNADPTYGPQSLAYLDAIWPRLDWAAGGIQWSGQAGGGPFYLEGDECLVFFLGGIPDPNRPGTSGFSTNPKNPTTAGGDRVSFFEFPTAHLVKYDPDNGNKRVNPAGNNTAVPRFYSFLDPFGKGKPYVYYNSGKRKDGYNQGITPSGNTYKNLTKVTVLGDCTLIPGGPYFEPGTNPTRFQNAGTFQIISAGANNQYGPGGGWSAPQATSIGSAGADDHVNFNNGAKLGVPQ